MRDYFGSQIAFYFGFSRFYTTYLYAPAALGLSLFAYERARGEAMDDVLPLFNIVITIWSTLLVARWKHREATLASAWGVLNREDETREKQLVEAVEKGAPARGPRHLRHHAAAVRAAARRQRVRHAAHPAPRRDRGRRASGAAR